MKPKKKILNLNSKKNRINNNNLQKKTSLHNNISSD
jgi:hypothetical protein